MTYALFPASTCALTTVRTIKCWGYNLDGELGDGTTVIRLAPVDLNSSTSDFTAIVSGGKKKSAVKNKKQSSGEAGDKPACAADSSCSEKKSADADAL